MTDEDIINKATRTGLWCVRGGVHMAIGGETELLEFARAILADQWQNLALAQLGGMRDLMAPAHVEIVQMFIDGKAFVGEARPPVDMILYCPTCGVQHIDAPEEMKVSIVSQGGKPAYANLDKLPWTNPPHRSHLCQACGHIWRPADVCTNGVASIATRGEKDSLAVPTPKLIGYIRMYRSNPVDNSFCTLKSRADTELRRLNEAFPNDADLRRVVPVYLP